MTDFIAQTRNDARATPEGNLWRMMAGVLRAAQLRLGAAARAHDRRRASEGVGADTMPDTGVAPETASGLPAWQAALPFFMQSGFGRR